MGKRSSMITIFKKLATLEKKFKSRFSGKISCFLEAHKT
jgi:hypothetical protein